MFELSEKIQKSVHFFSRIVSVIIESSIYKFRDEVIDEFKKFGMKEADILSLLLSWIKNPKRL